MIFLPDTNTCISLLRQKQPRLIARWQSTKVTDIVLCSVVVYELRHGAKSNTDPRPEHAKLDVFLSPFSSRPFDDACAVKCAEIRRALERKGETIGSNVTARAGRGARLLWQSTWDSCRVATFAPSSKRS